MHSLLKKVVVGSAVVGSVKGAVIPMITPAPSADLLAERQDPDAISLAQVLLTAVPESLRQIAATNLPAVSSILWEEFLDDQRPEWFEELPREIQNYLVRKFGPQTAWPTEKPTSGGLSGSADFTATVTAKPSQSTQTPQTSESASQTRTQATESTRVTTATTASSNQTSQPTASATSFETSYTSTSPSSDSKSSATRSHTTLSSTTLANPSEASTSSTPSSPTAEPDAPATSNNHLSEKQKIGLGVGIPFGLLGVAALFLACCMICRRRKKKHVEGSIPPSSPGFIPRFDLENVEHRTSLIREANHSTHDACAAWDDDGVDPTESMPGQNPYVWNDLGAYSKTNVAAQAPITTTSAYLDNGINGNNYSNVPVMTMNDPKMIMAPALYHTHSSNRARGKRTSYTSLHSVAEVCEPDELESPILGRNIPPKDSPSRNFMPAPAIPADAQIRRKPVPSSPPLPPLPPLATNPSPVATSPAAQAASHKLLRQTMPEHSGSSSSGLALTTSSGLSSDSSLAVHAEAASPISPTSNRTPSNPFHYDSYVEDYGPEFQYGYVDIEDGLYGGNTSLSQYPEPRRKNSKTEWPLRNIVGSHHRRRSSPIWERLSEE